MTTQPSLAMASLLIALAACATQTTQDKGAASLPAAAPEAPAPTTTPAPAAASSPAAPAAPSASAPSRPACASNFAAFDTNADERVSREEFLDRPHAHPDPESVFSARDADADGVLTSAEFCSGWHPGRGPHMSGGPGMGPAGRPGMGAGGMGPARGPGMGMGPGGMGPMRHGPRCEAHFARFDTNADGNVTESEFAALPHPHADAREVFAARDQNHDGRLTQAEFCSPWSAPSMSAPPASP